MEKEGLPRTIIIVVEGGRVGSLRLYFTTHGKFGKERCRTVQDGTGRFSMFDLECQ